MTSSADPQTSGTGTGTGPAAVVRPRLVTRALLLRFVTVIGASTSFFLLLSVVPLYAQESSGGGSNAAGLATGALMLATVAGELITPRFVNRYGYRVSLAVGLVLLGAPALVLTAFDNIGWIVAVCLLRGLGFALTVVAGGALTVSLIPPERRGEGLALTGIVAGVPSLVGLPAGVWLATHFGYTPVAVAGGVAALAAIVVVPGLPDREPTPDRPLGMVAGFRTPGLLRPTLVFATTALGAGIVVTFLPSAVPSTYTGLVAVALFVQPAASTAARWAAGRHGDRHGPAGLVVPGLLASAAGILITALTGNPVALVAGVALFGTGFGVAQNATLTLMYARVTASGYGAVSALWNVAYDAGMGVGAVGFGALAGPVGYPRAFALTAALMLIALLPAWRDRVADRAAAAQPR
ncbi:MFS transporter [Streptomyces coffeae]|uniref:MFS transporter n=1 Tax=Streptomyces coffeae TaxID=621382 RepID=A0ABS1N9E9_9ACTN|nr:MFS transporter [Streptomyces coffeae]MBL1096693.1 MFS transporter [Streptomyces coffeae]